MYDGPPRPSVPKHGLTTASESHPTALPKPLTQTSIRDQGLQIADDISPGHEPRAPLSRDIAGG